MTDFFFLLRVRLGCRRKPQSCGFEIPRFLETTDLSNHEERGRGLNELW